MNDEYSTGESFGENWLLGVHNYGPSGGAHDASPTYSSSFNYDSDLDLNSRHPVESGGVDPGANYTDEPDTKYTAVSNVLCMVLARG